MPEGNCKTVLCKSRRPCLATIVRKGESGLNLGWGCFVCSCKIRSPREVGMRAARSSSRAMRCFAMTGQCVPNRVYASSKCQALRTFDVCASHGSGDIIFVYIVDLFEIPLTYRLTCCRSMSWPVVSKVVSLLRTCLFLSANLKITSLAVFGELVFHSAWNHCSDPELR